MTTSPATQQDIKDLHKKIDDKHEKIDKKIDDKHSKSDKKMDALIGSLHELSIAINSQVAEAKSQKGATDRINRDLESLKSEVKEVKREGSDFEKRVLSLEIKQSGIMWTVMKVATPVLAVALSVSGLTSIAKVIGG